VDFYIPPPEPVFIPEPIVVQPIIVEPEIIEPVIEEPVQQPTGIQNVAIYEGEVDLITMQTKLAEVTLKFNESIQKIADQKQQLEAINTNMTSLQNDRESLSSQVISLQANTTAIDMKDNQINILEANIVSLTSDRDQWKALANNWYGVAMAQLEVMVNILGI
jgi:chromosome segregation ATPase